MIPRGKLGTPKSRQEREDLEADENEVNGIHLEVALEKTARVVETKDGKLVKRYSGFETEVDHVMDVMKADIFGRTIRPWKVGSLCVSACSALLSMRPCGPSVPAQKSMVPHLLSGGRGPGQLRL